MTSKHKRGKPKIKVAFCDFWPTFDPKNNYFMSLLEPEYDMELSDDPDFVIYSSFGRRHIQYGCTRIFYTGENERPDFSACDYAFTFDHSNDPRHYRLPLYALYCRPEQLIKGEVDVDAIRRRHTRFCNFVYSNPRSEERIKFFLRLQRYKHVDSGGALLNNIGRSVRNKVEFISNYKFTIAFEKSSYPGYTTEKIVEPMLGNSLPIYWGNPTVNLDFNTRSFLNYGDAGSFNALLEQVIELDQNDDLYVEYLRQPWYHDNRVNQYIDPENVRNQFHQIFADNRRRLQRPRQGNPAGEPLRPARDEDRNPREQWVKHPKWVRVARAALERLRFSSWVTMLRVWYLIRPLPSRRHRRQREGLPR